MIFTDPLLEQGGTFLLNGNAAIVRAALMSHVRFFASYPGSPVTSIGELMIKAKDHYSWLHAQYSINESVALFGATGASWSGARALISMKHVGLHVSCDPYAYLGYTGTKGGIVLVVGMDPGAKCSTGEFDIRFLNSAYHWIMLEPANVKEVYQLIIKGFELSEKWKLPVILIMNTELCTQFSTIESGEITVPQRPDNFGIDTQYISNGPLAVCRHQNLIETINELADDSEDLIFRKVLGNDNKHAIISSGSNFPAAYEAVRKLGLQNVDLIKLSLTYPLPRKKLLQLLEQYSTLFVCEELDGFLSHQLLAFAKINDLPLLVKRLGSDLKSSGSLSLEKITDALLENFSISRGVDTTVSPGAGQQFEIPARPGTFCPGCPYRGLLYTIKRISKDEDIYGGDIGCSSLPPYYSDWLTCMGSGLGIAHGAAAIKDRNTRVYSSMGDSTFFHCGMPSIINCIQQNTPITLFILDNRWTAMTGHQPLPNTLQKISIYDIVKSFGVEHLWEVEAYDLYRMRDIINHTNNSNEFIVIIVKGECRLMYEKRLKQQDLLHQKSCIIAEENCHQCGECYEILGCPAIEFSDDTYRINQDLCNKCGMCAQICPNGAISVVEYDEVLTYG